jgi:uncharacterized protein with ACT and thioredoxin-like domain
MSDEAKQERSVSDEISQLGKQFSEVIRTAWESDDRKRIQGEIIEGLRRFGDEVTEALQKVAESDTGKQVSTQTEKVISDVKQSGIADDVRKGVLQGLDTLNRELGKLSERLEREGEVAAEAEKASEPES